MRATTTNSRWAGLAILIQIVALFSVESSTPDSLSSLIPILLVGSSLIITTLGWLKLKRWH